MMHVQTCTRRSSCCSACRWQWCLLALCSQVCLQHCAPEAGCLAQFRSASKPGGHGSMESQLFALDRDISKGAIPAPEPPSHEVDRGLCCSLLSALSCVPHFTGLPCMQTSTLESVSWRTH